MVHRLRQYPQLAVRLGGSYLAYRKMMRLAAGEGSTLALYPDAVLGIGQATAKWFPYRQTPFFLTAGGGYTWHPELNFRLEADNKLTFGGLEMTPEDVGTVTASLRWNRLLGYAGFGYGRAIPRRRIGLSIELGCYYLGAPRVNLDYEGFLETTTLRDEMVKVQKNMTNYRYLPSLQFLISYALPTR
ncbi:hypothetical protein GCM10023187_51490 [Nibrella viscosa]|uniref:Outer membrane protein beta-barrel domain-containing protein n=1 Tax=Nibrella viscosa TaxID=1084524 RepID=A0ABP8KYE2_9BACT